MPGSDQTPGVWNFIGTQGDEILPTAFTLIFNGTPLIPVSAIAQVRQTRNRASNLILALTCDLASNVVTVGDGDNLDTVIPGLYHWDLQVTNATYPSGLTVVGGTFEVIGDVSELIV